MSMVQMHGSGQQLIQQSVLVHQLTKALQPLLLLLAKAPACAARVKPVDPSQEIANALQKFSLALNMGNLD